MNTTACIIANCAVVHHGLPSSQALPLSTREGAVAFLDRWLAEYVSRLSDGDVYPVCALMLTREPGTDRVLDQPGIFLVPNVHDLSDEEWLRAIRQHAQQLATFGAAITRTGKGGDKLPARYVMQTLEHPEGDVCRVAKLTGHGHRLVAHPPVAYGGADALRRLVPTRFLD